jgi:hypothetical protein
MEPFLDTEGGAAALRTVAVELERDSVPCAWRTLAEEFVLNTDGAASPVPWDEVIVFVLESDCGALTTELFLDKLFSGGVVCALVTELARDTEVNVSLCDLVADLVDAEETIEGVLATFAGRDPAVRRVETESVLDTETADDLGLEADLILGSGSSR